MKKILALLSVFLFVTNLNAQDDAGNYVYLISGSETTGFATLAEAITVANGLDTKPTIKLVDNVTKQKSTMKISSSMTIDLNGCNIVGTASPLFEIDGQSIIVDFADYFDYEAVEEGEADPMGSGTISCASLTDGNTQAIHLVKGTLNIYDANISAKNLAKVKDKPNASITAIIMEQGTNLIMDGGEIYASSMRNTRAIEARGASTNINIISGTILAENSDKTTEYGYAYGIIATNNATINISGGSVSSVCGYDSGYGIIIDSKASLTMTGGMVNSSCERLFSYAIYVSNGTVKIEGGTINATGKGNVFSLYVNSSNGKQEITGGDFHANAEFRSHYNINHGIPTSNISITGGNFDRQENLKAYIGEKYLALYPANSTEYKNGLRYHLTDENPIKGVAKNLTSGQFYQTLEEALDAAVANDTISLTADYTLAKDATVKKGVMLLLPFNLENTCFTDKPISVMLYPCESRGLIGRKLTMTNGATLTVEGELSVSSYLTSGNGGVSAGSGSPFDYFSAIEMSEGTHIQGNGNIYCWGYIYGKGTVTMSPTTTLYESFQILDWRGGNRTSSLYDHMFPFSQFAIQNLEVPVTFMPGSKNSTCTNLWLADGLSQLDNMLMVGPDEAYFTTTDNATIIRTYEPSTDRVTYDLCGDINLGGITMDIEGFKVYSTDYDMNITNNFTLNIKNGSLKMPYSYALLPGAEINIDKTAEMVLEKDQKLFVYDKNNWDCYTFWGYICPLDFTMVNGTSNRLVRASGNTPSSFSDKATWDKMSNAVLNINGKLTAVGQILTTLDGATICSKEGTGTIYIANDCTTEVDSTFMAIKSSFDPTNIPVTSMQLTNADGTKIKTAGARRGTVYTINDGIWVKDESGIVIPGDANNDGSVSVADLTLIAFYILGNATSDININNADLNEDGKISVADLTRIAAIILSDK